MNEKVLKLLNEQINKEFYSAYLYLDFANYFAKEGLDGFENWYRVQAKEEQDHAMMFYQYLQNKIGTSASLVSGIFYSILSSIILLYPGSVVRAIAIGIGISLTISGLVKVKWSFTLKGLDSIWVGTLIIGILTTILGIVLIFSPFSGDAITKITGAFLVVVAIFDLIDNYFLQK